MKDNRGQGIQESIPALLQEEKYACVYTHTHTFIWVHNKAALCGT